ncbi:hypothetical protein BH10PSE9_BH10PSE9_14880 [soil metagenome]
MRAIRWTLVVAVLSIVLAGCNTSSNDAGVGPDLYTGSLPENTKAQDDYVSAICAQAGGQATAAECTAPDGWTAFVQAGMNDIDQRCDQYLVWLDQRKRHAGPIQQQLTDTNTAATAIVQATAPASPAIGILTQVFGFASKTFTNINSGLLLEVDHSTVQAVVLGRQKQFRKALEGRRVPNRPVAIYALRSYLRICMPITIATEINTTITTFERTDSAPDALIDGTAVARSLIGTPTSQVPEQGAIRTQSDTRFTQVERSLTPAYIRQVQRTMCVAADGDLGQLGSATRRAISQYLNAHESKPSETINSENDTVIRAAVAALPDCLGSKLKNSYEVAVLGVPDPGETMESGIAEFQETLANYLQKNGSIVPVRVTRMMDDQTRAGIVEARKVAKQPATRSDELDPKLLGAIRVGAR